MTRSDSLISQRGMLVAADSPNSAARPYRWIRKKRRAMTEDRRARLWALFDQAADLPPQEQHALLDAACPDDAALRAEVERLLADDARLHADGGAPDFLDSPVARSPTPALPAPGAAVTAALPPRIGRY